MKAFFSFNDIWYGILEYASSLFVETEALCYRIPQIPGPRYVLYAYRKQMKITFMPSFKIKGK